MDQAQRILEIAGEGRLFDIHRDVAIIDAERWTTPVTLDLFRESTGDSAFPDYLSRVVEDDVLHLAGNGQIDYSMCSVWPADLMARIRTR